MKITIRDAKQNDLKNIAQIYVYSWKKAFSKFLLPSTINKLNVEEKEVYLKSILDNNGKTKNVCYYDLTKVPNDGEKLHINKQLMDYLREVRSMARKDIVIDDEVSDKE